jgi:SAM-dependent methyltransferase
MTDSPFPELKKTHTMAHTGRPWRDRKPPPSAPVWAIIQGFGSYWMLVAAIELGVFDAIEGGGPTAVAPLAEQLGASPFHLTHLLDALVSFGFLDQVDEIYELTETAERYLCTNGAASMAALVGVANGPHDNWSRLAETIRTGHVATPLEDDAVGFYSPLVRATFPTQLRAAGRLGAALGWARRPGLRVLDLGAGRAPWSIGILSQSPESTAVVNDYPEVLDLAAATITEHGLQDRVELWAGDFHEIEFERSQYDVVVLGHICRTEGEERATRLIARAHRALRPGGQLILADYFADNGRKYNPFGVQMGMTMLASTTRGGMLTHAQVSGWLRDAGFVAIRLMEPIGFNQVYVATTPEDRTGTPQDRTRT